MDRKTKRSNVTARTCANFLKRGLPTEEASFLIPPFFSLPKLIRLPPDANHKVMH